jgi:hypothetical protein
VPYDDPRGRFQIEYPAGWQVRTPATGATMFYLDDPTEGIAVRVVSPGVVLGRVDAAALAPIVVQHLRQAYPDFTVTAMATRPLANGRERSEFTARWTNRWAQPMRATGVIVSETRAGETTYAYVAGQAQALVYPALEPVFHRVLESFRGDPRS